MFWNKVEQAKRQGLTADQFEKIEAIESAIAYHENEIQNYEEEIERIKNTAESSLENVWL